MQGIREIIEHQAVFVRRRSFAVQVCSLQAGCLESSSALNEVNDQDDDGNNEQEVDQAAANVADEAKKPEHDQDDNYSPEHGSSFRLS
jgi:hypothetical protein